MRKLSLPVQRVVDARDHTGETPVWSVTEQVLYWIDCHGPPRIRRFDPASGDVRSWPMPERCGGIVLKQGGGILVTLAGGLFDFDCDSAALIPRASSPLPGHVALHECTLDPSGRLWVGSIDTRVGPDNLYPGGASLFRLEGRTLVEVIDGMSCTNGLAFSADRQTMYVSDSTTQRCDRYDVDPETGAIRNRSTFFQLEPDEGFIDGATVDAEGGYWVALVYAARLRRYRPDGTIDAEIELPFDNPTKPAFGGPDMRTIFVTSTSDTLGHPAQNPLDGGLFALETGFTGNPEPLFAG